MTKKSAKKGGEKSNASLKEKILIAAFSAFISIFLARIDSLIFNNDNKRDEIGAQEIIQIVGNSESPIYIIKNYN